MKALKFFISGILAGFIIGLGGLCFILTKTYLGASGQVIGSLIFPIGLFLICVIGLDLYTGKIGFVFKDKTITISRLLLMLLGNLVGSVLMGTISYLLFKDNTAIMNVTKSLVIAKSDLGGINIVTFIIKSILCGMMVFLAVYLYKKALSDFMKFISVLIPIFIFVLCGFEHCIADAFYFSFNLSFNINTLVLMIFSIIFNSIGSLILYEIIYFLEKE